MIFKLTNISVVLFVTTVINFFTTYVSWQRRKTQGGIYIAFGMMGITLWTLAAGLDYAAIPIPLKVFFAKLEYTGYNIALSLLAIFSLFYVGYDGLWKNKWTRVFFALPSVSILLAWTNDLHGWLWSGFARSAGGNNTVIYEHGPGFLWTLIIGYLMVAVIVVNLWRASRRGAELSRRQARLLLFATFIPVASNLVYLFENEFTNGVDWTSITFSISGFLFLMALYGTRFLDIAPIARHTIFERMGDGVLVLDTNNNLVDFNLAAQKFFGLGQHHVGSPLHFVMVNWPEIVKFALSNSNEAFQATITHTDRPIVFDTRLTSLEDERGQIYGKLVVCRDITEAYQAGRVLEHRLVEIQELHEELQRSQEQIVAQQRDLARNEERQHMARNLHDSVSQSIHSMVLFSETLAATLEKNDLERARLIIERLQESARQSHKETRLLLYELQAEGPGRSVDLIRNLEERLAKVERHSGVKTQVNLEGQLEYCPLEWREDLFWIAIEALNNALKHAQARAVRIVIRCSPEQMEMEVSDDGIGFDPKKVGAGGMGLKNLRARADIIGGKLTIESEPTKGTSVRIVAEIKAE